MKTNIVYTETTQEPHDNSLAEVVGSFPTPWKNRIERLYRKEDIQLFINGKLLVIWGLKHLYNVELDLNEIVSDTYGKPYVLNRRINFNISHSGSVACCIFQELDPVGIDIELIDSNLNIDEFRQIMTPLEWHTINKSTSNLVSFYRYWTQKEAAAKLVGKGFGIPFESFQIEDGETLIDCQKIYLKEVPLYSNYICSIATLQKIPDSQLHISYLANMQTQYLIKH